jgi:hypothetical protein
MLLFKKDIKYSLDGKTIEKHIFKSGEEYSLDSVLNALGKNNLDFFVQDGVIETNNIQTQPTINEEPIFETIYKVTQPIQDKDGNEIELGTQFSESELKQIISQDKRQSKKKIAELLQEEKIMELKIVK